MAAGIAVLSLTLWTILGTTVIFFNASLLQHYRHPIALTCWHMVVSCMLVAVVQLVRPGLLSTGDEAKGIAPLTFRRSVELGVPVAVMAACGLVMTNAAYLYLTASFIQMMKAGTSASVYMVGCLLGTQTWSVPVAKTLAVITLGLIIATIEEVKFDARGFLLQLAALLSEAVRINLLEVRLKSAGYRLNPLSSMKIFAPLIMVILGSLMVVLDPAAMDVEAIRAIGYGTFALNGAVACCLNLSVFLAIQVASGLTFALAGILKDSMIILGAGIFKGEGLCTTQLVGYCMAVLGLQVYAAVSKAPADFEAGVLPTLARRLRALVSRSSSDDGRELLQRDGSKSAT